MIKTLPAAVKLVAVAAPRTGVTMTMLVLVQALMLPLVTVPNTGVVNTMLVLVQALMFPEVTVPRIGPVMVGVAIVGLVNSKVLLMLLVVPAWTNGTMSAALMTVATGRPEMATVVIIKNSQRKCCSVDD